MNFIMSIVQGHLVSRNIITGQNFLVWSLHTWKSIHSRKKVRRFEGRLSESPYSKRALLEVGYSLHSKCFLRFCKAAVQVGSPERFTSQIIRQAQCLHVTKFRCALHKFIAFKRTSQSPRCTEWFA